MGSLNGTVSDGVLTEIDGRTFKTQQAQNESSARSSSTERNFWFDNGPVYRRESAASTLRWHCANIILYDIFDSINGSTKHPQNKGPVEEDSIYFSFWEYALLILGNMDYVNKHDGKINNGSSVFKKFESTIRGYMAVGSLAEIKCGSSLKFSMNSIVFALRIHRKLHD